MRDLWQWTPPATETKAVESGIDQGRSLGVEPLIAGHIFSLEGKCTCGYKFSDISDARREHIGKPHWAHQGSLTENEYHEIEVERDRIWATMEGAWT